MTSGRFVPRVSLGAHVYIDGAARGNPGLAGIGAYACDAETQQDIFRLSKFIGHATNNVAEYLAAIYALFELQARHIAHVRVYSDSELLVKQMIGTYRVRNEQLRWLHDLVVHLRGRFAACAFEHIPREQNQTADRLANEGIDRRAEIPA